MHTTTTVFVMRCPTGDHTTRAAIPLVRELFGPMFGWTCDPDSSGLSRAHRRVTDAKCAALWNRVRHWALTPAPPLGGLLPGRLVAAVNATALPLPRSPNTMQSFPIGKDDLGQETHYYPLARLVSAMGHGATRAAGLAADVAAHRRADATPPGSRVWL